MKKFICSLGMMSFLAFGVVNESHGQVIVKEKRAMSRGTKGALIGGAAGALGGGILGHGAGGALIGGAAGAGAGYLIGRHRDNKYGGYRPLKVKKRYYHR